MDILGTFFLAEQDSLTVTEPEKRKPTAKTITLMQNVEVLALGKQAIGAQFSSKEKERYGTVTLALTPIECELLAYTESIGRLQLVLRNPTEPYLLEEEGEPRKFTHEENEPNRDEDQSKYPTAESQLPFHHHTPHRQTS